MDNSRRRSLIAAIVVALLILLLLLLVRCKRTKSAASEPAVAPPTAAATAPITAQPAAVAPGTKEPDEVLTPATVQAPPQAGAGAVFPVTWTGPNNRGDYLTIVRKEAPGDATGVFRLAKEGSKLQLTAHIEPGEYEVRYVTARSRKVLGRAPVTIVPAGATLDAAVEVVLGAKISVTWTGPDNKSDYVTLVLKETPDGQYGNYTYTRDGSPLTVTAPPVTGDAELRYMTGQGNKVIGRRAIRIIMADVSLSAPAEVAAGSTVNVTWTGPNNPSDFVTLVAKGTPDGEYGNYGYTRDGSPVPLIMPFLVGDAELRYMNGQGYKVLGRRPIRLVAVEVSISASVTAAAGSPVSIIWTGPAYSGDYLTIVPKGKADGEYEKYTNASEGSPLTVNAPKTTGEHEIRYMTGQGGKVLARRPILITP